MLNFTTAEYVGESRRGSFLSVAGSRMGGPTETFLSGLLGQWSSSDLSLHQLKVDVPLLATLESDFTYSTASTSVLNQMN